MYYVLTHKRQDELKLLEIQERQEQEEEQQRRRMVRFVCSLVYCCGDVGIDGGVWGVSVRVLVPWWITPLRLLLSLLSLSTAAARRFAVA